MINFNINYQFEGKVVQDGTPRGEEVTCLVSSSSSSMRMTSGEREAEAAAEGANGIGSILIGSIGVSSSSVFIFVGSRA